MNPKPHLKMKRPHADLTKEIIYVCRILMEANTTLSLEWTAENRSMFTFLKSREILEDSRVETDMFHLTGLYVCFGTEVFDKIDRYSKKPAHLFLSELTMKYKIFEDPSVFVPRMRVTDIVRHFPFYVAEHLYMGRGDSFGRRSDLPRCLTFSGGIHLIPTNPEWENLVLMWKVWKSSFANEHIEDCPRLKYIIIDYLPIDNDKREGIMTHFLIEKPTIEQGLKAISDAIGGCIYDRFHATGINPFITDFECYCEDIENYYKRNTGEDFDFNRATPSVSKSPVKLKEESS